MLSAIRHWRSYSAFACSCCSSLFVVAWLPSPELGVQIVAASRVRHDSLAVAKQSAPAADSPGGRQDFLFLRCAVEVDTQQRLKRKQKKQIRRRTAKLPAIKHWRSYSAFACSCSLLLPSLEFGVQIIAAIISACILSHRCPGGSQCFFCFGLRL